MVGFSSGKNHKRGKQKRADYILYYKPNIPIAIIEGKDNNHTVVRESSRRSVTQTPRRSISLLYSAATATPSSFMTKR